MSAFTSAGFLNSITDSGRPFIKTTTSGLLILLSPLTVQIILLIGKYLENLMTTE